MDQDLITNLTNNGLLRDSPDYQAVIAVLDRLARTGVLYQSAGNCVAISEMLSHLLTDQGIDNHMIECKLLVTRNNPLGLDFVYIGYNNGTKQGGIHVDTHVVVITKTATPMLIDLSIQHCLPQGRLWLCEALNTVNSDPEYLGVYDLDTVKFTYTRKRNLRLPELHQKSLLERMDADRRAKQSITVIKLVLFVVGLLTVINFVLNSLQIWLRLDHINDLKQEVQRLERTLEQNQQKK